MRRPAAAHLGRALRQRRKSQPGSQRGRFRPALTWRRPLSTVKRCPRPSRGRDAPPSVVGFGTWQVRPGRRWRPGSPGSRDGGGGGRGRGTPGRLCGGGEARAEGAAGPGAAGAAGRGGHAPARPTGRESPPGLGDTAADGISAPAAGLSPPPDPARRPRWVGVLRPRGGEVQGGAGLAGATWMCLRPGTSLTPRNRPFIHSPIHPSIPLPSLSAPDRSENRARDAGGLGPRVRLGFSAPSGDSLHLSCLIFKSRGYNKISLLRCVMSYVIYCPGPSMLTVRARMRVESPLMLLSSTTSPFRDQTHAGERNRLFRCHCAVGREPNSGTPYTV